MTVFFVLGVRNESLVLQLQYVLCETSRKVILWREVVNGVAKVPVLPYSTTH